MGFQIKGFTAGILKLFQGPPFFTTIFGPMTFPVVTLTLYWIRVFKNISYSVSNQLNPTKLENEIHIHYKNSYHGVFTNFITLRFYLLMTFPGLEITLLSYYHTGFSRQWEPGFFKEDEYLLVALSYLK